MILLNIKFFFTDRARQTEIKKEQEQIRTELEPSNPNWQFLGMIMDYQETLGELKHIGMNDPVNIYIYFFFIFQGYSDL